ncbi:MAG: class II aldolase/adducin family protein [Eubacteriaceae bacterium]|jgi:L-fuculose-phosphate aldolase|nr:class II aldolase/adducin family protein [Eubacteriaceae bacterium]
MIERNEAKKLVIRAGRELSDSGLIARTWGNVGARVSPYAFVITASGIPYEDLTENDVVEVSMADLTYKGKVKPSSEKKLHRRIYQVRPEVDFILHTHQDYASAVSAMGLDHVWFDKEYEGIGPGVLCAKYALPGTQALCKNVGDAVAAALGGAVIMKRHGAVCYGRTYEEVFRIAHNLEEACGKYIEMVSPMLKRDLDEYGTEDGTMYLTDEEKMLGYEAVLNKDKVVMDYLGMDMDMPAYLDDFAQMIGPKAKFVSNHIEAVRAALKKAPAVLIEGEGVLCTGIHGDATAVSMLVRKNCIAYFAAASQGKARRLSTRDAVFMRRFYVTKYSKMQGKQQK